MYHALSCKKHGGLIIRHDLVKDVFAKLLKAGRATYEVEPPQAWSGSKRRPDVLVRLAWHGHDAAYDITVHSPLRDSNSVKATIKDQQKFLETASRSKKNKYQEKCAENGT